MSFTKLTRPAEGTIKKNDDWRPQDTLTAFQKYLVGIEGPLTTPVGGGYRYRKMTKSIFLLQHSPCTKIP